MKIHEIKKFPTSLETEDVRKELAFCKGFHESLMKSYQTLEKVKELLRLNTPQEVVLEIIEEIYR